MHNGIVYGFIRCWKGHKTLKHFDYIHLIHGKRMIRRRLKIMANTRINYSIYTMFECVTRESHWTYIWWERVRVAVRCKMWSQTPTVSYTTQSHRSKFRSIKPIYESLNALGTSIVKSICASNAIESWGEFAHIHKQSFSQTFLCPRKFFPNSLRDATWIMWGS